MASFNGLSFSHCSHNLISISGVAGGSMLLYTIVTDTDVARKKNMNRRIHFLKKKTKACMVQMKNFILRFQNVLPKFMVPLKVLFCSRIAQAEFYYSLF